MRKPKFDAERYIDKNYVEDEDAIISINVPHLNSFYNEFDADKLALSDDIIDFIDSRVKNIPHKYNIVLEFIVSSIRKQDKKNVISIVKAHYGLASSSRDQNIKTSNLKALVLSLVGIICLLISFSLSDYDTLIREVFYISGWVCAWETFNALLIDRASVRNNKRNLDRLYNAKIIFTQRGKDINN